MLQGAGFRLVEFHIGVDVGHGNGSLLLLHIVEGALGEHLEQMGVDRQLVLSLLQLALVEIQRVLQLLDAGALLLGGDEVVGELRSGDKHAVGRNLQAGDLNIRTQPIDENVVAAAFQRGGGGMRQGRALQIDGGMIDFSGKLFLGRQREDGP